MIYTSTFIFSRVFRASSHLVTKINLGKVDSLSGLEGKKREKKELPLWRHRTKHRWKNSKSNTLLREGNKK